MDEDKENITEINGQEDETEDRKLMYEKLEGYFNLPIVSFFTSFVYPVMIDEPDSDLLEAILQLTDTSKGFILMLSSPGGSAIEAERIIRLCRKSSGTGEYVVVIPKKAKSAATMISFGSTRIVMSGTSELGPVDPQVIFQDSGALRRFSVYNIVNSYEDLFERAIKTRGNLEPFKLQLEKYDERVIEEYRAAISLSKNISVTSLKTGMLCDLNEAEIESQIQIFLNPIKGAFVHERPIYAEAAKSCGLQIEIKEIHSKEWREIYNLYFEINQLISENNISKCIENKSESILIKCE